MQCATRGPPRFGTDTRVIVLCYRSAALYCLGYPDAARADADYAFTDACGLGQAATLMSALAHLGGMYFIFRNYTRAKALLDELVPLANEKKAAAWKAQGISGQGSLLAVGGKASDAVPIITEGIAAMRSSGTTLWLPFWLPFLARAYADLGKFDDAWRCIDEARWMMATSSNNGVRPRSIASPAKSRLCRGTQMRPKRKLTLSVRSRLRVSSRQSHGTARGDEHGAALARSGETTASSRILAPVYGWFTGFHTLDLKEAKALLDDLARPH